MSKNSQLLPTGHVLLPALAIGSLALLLAAGLSLLGILGPLNAALGERVMPGADFPKSLPVWLLWLATLGFAFGLSFALLNISGTWRRLVLWVTALVLIAGWAPVLGLAAHAPEIGAPWIAALWSGVCALVYAGNHRMACDITPRVEKNSSDIPHEAR
jgi:hypothetical protein